jgi:GTP-binding protein
MAAAATRASRRRPTRTPRTPRRGKPARSAACCLSLKLIADVGLIGLPNAGKSTLLATLTKARPKIAGYPVHDARADARHRRREGRGSLRVADIPGLIEGAHARARGLGDKFLKHVERTRLLLHLVDCSSSADMEPVAARATVLRELAGYGGGLAERPRLLVATKVEDDEARANAARLQAESGEPVWAISAATRAGLPELLGWIAQFVRRPG